MDISSTVDLLPDASKRRRASRPKARTGCKTCKIRRIKCDETRPACERCLRTGRVCDGYPLSSRQDMNQNRPLWTLAPAGLWSQRHEAQYLTPNELPKRPQLELDERSNSSSEASSSQLTRYQPSWLLFNDSREQQYYDYYLEVTAKQLSGWFDGEVWNLLMLQASLQEPFVRHSLVAIAALTRTLECKGISGYDEALVQHRQFAFQQYGKAVKLMREAFVKGDGKIRDILLSCLLTVCFESFHGFHESMCYQIAGGVQILEDWSARHMKRLAQPPSKINRLGSPAPEIVEDELYHAFSRLDIKSMYTYDGRPFDIHRKMSAYGAEAIDAMPSAFTSLQQAESYLWLIIRRGLHFLNSVTPVAQMKAISKATSDGMSDADAEEFLTFRLFEADDSTSAASRSWLKHISVGVDKCLDEIGKWKVAFQPVHMEAKAQKGSKADMIATLLVLYVKTAIIRISGAKATDECFYDKYNADLAEVARLSEIVLDSTHSQHPAQEMLFCFDTNIILPLLVVASKSRDRFVRRKGVELMRRYPRKESTWNTLCMANLADAMIELEEEGLEDGDTFVPESNRLRILSIVRNYAQRTAVVKLQRNRNGVKEIIPLDIMW